MDSPLQKKPDTDTKAGIINQLWPRRPSVQLQADDLDWDAYFAFYSDQCKTFKNTTLTTHRTLVEAARALEKLPSKVDVREALRLQIPDSKPEKEHDHIIEDSIILVIRLFIMMEIGRPRLGFTGRPPLLWNDGDLKTFVQDYFNEPPALNHAGIKFEPIFNARNLERVAGIKIEWTSNLADHLRMMEDDGKTVAIFHHASFLRWHQRYSM
jgi:hypothetical protein